jgi:hypothetical protein
LTSIELDDPEFLGEGVYVSEFLVHVHTYEKDLRGVPED